jgi:hypothetical protein
MSIINQSKFENEIPKENNVEDNFKILSSNNLSNNNSDQNEEEIIDELISRRISNNICCLNKDNISLSFCSNKKYYQSKSKRICHSADSKKTKKMKLKDWLDLNIENNKKIEEDIEDLIIEIFVNRYNSYPNSTCDLSPNALQSKKQSDLFCPKLIEFSIYILSILHQKFYSFFEFLIKKINFRALDLSEVKKLKEILYYTGIDLKTIFKKAFEKTFDFNLSSILIIIFDEFLVKENRIKEEIIKELRNSPLYKEKEKFEKYLKIAKQQFFGSDDEGENQTNEENNINNNELLSNYFSTDYDENADYNNDINDANDNDNDNNNNDNDYVNEANDINAFNEIDNEEIDDNYDNENDEIVSKEEENKNIINQKINKENKKINEEDKENINNNDDDNYKDIKKNKNKRKNKSKKNENNSENNNLIQNLNLDDLVNYINESDNKEKKKKKKKKKGKKKQKNLEKEESNYVEEDLIILDYKKSLEEYTNNIIHIKKVKPKYSEEFLKKLQILSSQI